MTLAAFLQDQESAQVDIPIQNPMWCRILWESAVCHSWRSIDIECLRELELVLEAWTQKTARKQMQNVNHEHPKKQDPLTHSKLSNKMTRSLFLFLI